MRPIYLSKNDATHMCQFISGSSRGIYATHMCQFSSGSDAAVM
ncbi:MAG TPA: hypothetical protein PLI57_03840 [Spirochaetota bacterium]|nr:hypothetical protein [Spirochaetota bacterium]